MAAESQTTTFSVYDGGSPNVAVQVGEVRRITGFRSGQSTEIDVTHLSSTGKEFLIGLKDEGSMQIEVNYDANDAGQIRLEELRTSRAAGTFEIAAPDDVGATVTFSFTGRVTQFPVTWAVDDAQRGTVTVRITGDVAKSIT